MKFEDIQPGTQFTSASSGYVAIKLATPTNQTRTSSDSYSLSGQCIRCGMKSPYQNAVPVDGTERTIHLCGSDTVIVEE